MSSISSSPAVAPDTTTPPAQPAGTETPPVIKPKIGVYRRHLLLCTGPRCTQDGESEALFESLGARLKEAGLTTGDLRVKRTRTSCFAACKGGPILCVQPDGVWYYNVTPDNMQRIIDEHLLGGKPVQSLIFHQGPGFVGEEDEGEDGTHGTAA